MNSYHPHSIDIELTHQCNLKCPSCAIIDDIKAALPGPDISKITSFLKEVKQYWEIRGVCLTGGEPFINQQRLTNIFKTTPIPVVKINTNGVAFFDETTTKSVLKHLEPYFQQICTINISISQQTDEGISLANAIHAFDYFFINQSATKFRFGIRVFTSDKDRVDTVVDQLHSLYKTEFNATYDESLFPLKVIPSDGRICSTASSHLSPMVSLANLLLNYLSDPNVILNCQSGIDSADNLFPRMLLRANGDLFACTGYAHVHKLGNILVDSAKEIYQRAIQNKILQAIYSKGPSTIIERVQAKKW